MFVKLRPAEQESVDDYTNRALKHGITVKQVYKELGLNVMIRFLKHDGTGDHEHVANITRFGELVKSLERAEQLKAYLANGGTIRQFDSEVAAGSGLNAVATRGRRAGKNGGRKAEPISTGDAKFDMYLNALPEPVRVLVVPLGWDPRELYKEYRTLKKDGIIAKYATDENKAAAAEKVA
jgi:hypothetical protein